MSIKFELPSNIDVLEATSISATTVTATSIVATSSFTVDGFEIDLGAGASLDQVLQFDGTKFVAATIGGGDLSGSLTSTYIPYATGTTTLSNSGLTWNSGISLFSVAGDARATNRLILSASSAAVSSSGSGAFRFNTGTNHLEISEDGYAWEQLLTTASSGVISGSFTTGTVPYASSATDLDDSGLTWDNSNQLLGIGQATPVAKLDILQANASSGTPTALKVSGGTMTTLSAGSEIIDVYLNLARTVQRSNGAVATQRAVLITPPVYTFTSASTITTAATFTVSGSPAAGTNATITNAYSIWAQLGLAAFDEHIKVDGYLIDLSGGATTNQILTYNGTKFLPATNPGNIGGTLTSTKVPYATGSSTISDSNMAWDSSNKILTVTTNASTIGLKVTEGTRTVGLGVDATTSSGQVGTVSNHDLTFLTNSTVKMVLTASGLLDAYGDIRTSQGVIFDGYSAAVSASGGGKIRYNPGTDHLEFSENGGAWAQFGSAASSGAIIGDPVTGGSANVVLFADGSGDLSQSASNFTWDGYTLHLGRDSLTTTNVWGLQLENSIVTTNISTQQFSPGINLKYHQWNGSVDKINEWFVQGQGLSGSNAGGLITFMNRQGATGSFTRRFSMETNRTGDTYFTIADPTITTTMGIYDVAEFNSSANHGFVGTSSSHDFVIRVSNSGRARFDTSGNFISGPIGINTTSSAPSVPLEVRGSSTNQIKTYTTSTGGYADINFANTGGTNQVAIGYGNSTVVDTTRQSRGFIYTGANNFVITDGTTPFYLLTQSTGQHTFTQPVLTTGSPTGFQITGGAHTTLTASVESIDGYYKLDRTVQFSVGSLTRQRAVYIAAPTYGFTGPSTLTTAATLAVGNAPQQGANATITNAYSIWAQAGVAAFDGHVKVDGYLVDLSGGASSTQVLAYNGTAFVPTNAAAGSISGSISANRVAYGSGADAIQGSANLTFNGSTLALTGALTVSNHMTLDGYIIDLSAGASDGQSIVYSSGSGKFIAQTVSGGPGGGFGTTGEKIISIIPGAFYTSTASTTAVVVGGFQVNAADYTITGTTLSFVFRAVASLGSATVSGYVKLRNVTDSSDVATLTFSSTSDATQESTVTGSISSTKIYEVRIYCSNVVTGLDFIQLLSAELRAINTIT